MGPYDERRQSSDICGHGRLRPPSVPGGRVFPQLSQGRQRGHAPQVAHAAEPCAGAAPGHSKLSGRRRGRERETSPGGVDCWQEEAGRAAQEGGAREREGGGGEQELEENHRRRERETDHVGQWTDQPRYVCLVVHRAVPEQGPGLEGRLYGKVQIQLAYFVCVFFGLWIYG